MSKYAAVENNAHIAATRRNHLLREVYRLASENTLSFDLFSLDKNIPY